MENNENSTTALVTVNTTYIVPDGRCEAFVRWAREECLPALETLEGGVLSRILAEEEPGHEAYSVRFTAGGADAQAWIDGTQPRLHGKLPPETLHFTTVMEHL